jgi:ABC-2 type transport system permease protein
MLWYKAWLETRSRFLIALVSCTVLCSRMVTVFLAKGAPGQVGRGLHTIHEILASAWLLAVALLAMGGLLREQAAGSASFTLSLPVTRWRLMAVRIAMGFIEAITLAIVPWIGMLLAAKVAGDSRFLTQAVLHVLLLLTGGLLFLALAYLISSFVAGEYTAPAVTAGAIITLAYELGDDKLQPFNPWAFMLGTDHFRWRTATFFGPVPWLPAGLFLTVAAIMILISIKAVQRRDF